MPTEYRRSVFRGLLVTVRPQHWLKNVLVAAAPLSAGILLQPGPALRTGGSPQPFGEVLLIVFHGDRDHTVAPVNADKLIASRVTPAHTGAVDNAAPPASTTTHRGDNAGHPYTRSVYRDAQNRVVAEQWTVHGGAHAWFGGSPTGSHTDARGPDASAEILRFFLEHETPRDDS